MFRFNTLRFEGGEGSSGTPAGASEGDQTASEGAASGQPDDGAQGGSPPADSSAGEGQNFDWEAHSRTHQSRADRAEAEARRANAELATLKSGTGETQTSGEDTPLTETGLVSLLDRRDSMNRAVTDLKDKFPNAHPEIYRRFTEYEDPDSLFLAAQESHQAETAYRERVRVEEAEKIRAAAAEGGGDDRTPAGRTEGGAGGAEPTVKELSEMSQAQLDAVEKANPGILEKVLRGAEQDVTFSR